MKPNQNEYDAIIQFWLNWENLKIKKKKDRFDRFESLWRYLFYSPQVL